MSVLPWSSHSFDSGGGSSLLRSKHCIQASTLDSHCRSGMLLIPEESMSALLPVRQWGRWNNVDGSAHSDSAALCANWQVETGRGREQWGSQAQQPYTDSDSKTHNVQTLKRKTKVWMIVTLKLLTDNMSSSVLNVGAPGLPLHHVRRTKLWNYVDILQSRTDIFQNTPQMIQINASSMNLELLGILIRWGWWWFSRGVAWLLLCPAQALCPGLEEEQRDLEAPDWDRRPGQADETSEEFKDTDLLKECT